MRSLLLAALAASLLALPASAQTAGGSLTLSGLAADVPSDQTQASVPFTVQFSLNQGTCVGGGQVKVDLTATTTGNATVSLSPATMTFRIGQADTLQGAFTGSGGSALLVKPGLVRSNTTVPVTVKAAGTVTCNAPGVGMAPAPLSAEGQSKLHFTPVSEEVANGPNEALPGLEVPALLGAVALAVFLARRKA